MSECSRAALRFFAAMEIYDAPRVSLKAKTSATDLRRHLYDVRRRVEYEVTFEGKERRIRYVVPFPHLLFAMLRAE